MQTYTAEDACWLYWRHFHLTTKGINIRRIKNFDKQREDVLKWVCFEKLAQIANKNNMNLNEYVPMIAAKQKESGKYFHPKTLISLPSLQIWNEKRQGAEQTAAQQKLVDSFMESFKFIIKFCVKNDISTFADYFRVASNTGTLDIHIASGKLSKYLLSLLPDSVLYNIKTGIEPDVAHQLNETVIKNKDALCSNTLTALRELCGIKISSTDSLSRFIDKNITKNNKI
jgi:hypothetical protein